MIEIVGILEVVYYEFGVFFVNALILKKFFHLEAV